MKVALVFVLLFATVLCRPLRKVSMSSSESSEEAVRQPAALAPQMRAAAVPAAAAASDESDESAEVEATATMEDESSSPDTTSATDTASVDTDEDEDDDDDDTDEDDTDEDESSDSSESGESSTPAPTVIIVTEEPVAETTSDPIEPTIVTDPETARGDNMGGYPSDYKSIVYVEDKSYHKIPSPYKSYEYMGKKVAYDMTHGNEVEKSYKVYKVHTDILEEDTSTPEVESQGLDVSTQDTEVDPRQASLPEEEEEDTTNSESSASDATATQEEDDDDSNSASTSAESEDEEGQSSEEATATPGAADSDESDSDESESEEDGVAPDATTDMPMVITAK